MLIFLDDGSGGTWQLDATPGGILRSQPGVGVTQTVILRAGDGSCWQLTIDNTGLLNRAAVAANPGYPNAVEFYSVLNQRFVLTVAPGGLFGVAGGAGSGAFRGSLIALLDVQTLDGTTYYWSDVNGVFPVA